MIPGGGEDAGTDGLRNRKQEDRNHAEMTLQLGAAMFRLFDVDSAPDIEF